MGNFALPVFLAAVAYIVFRYWDARKVGKTELSARKLAGTTPAAIRGWLALFCIILIPFSLMRVLEFNSYIDGAEKIDIQLSTVPSWISYQRYYWLLVWVSVLMSADAIWRLGFVPTWPSVMRAMAAVIVVGPILELMRLLVLPWLLTGKATLDWGDARLVLESSGWAAIWTVYFARSKRIRVRYGLAPWHSKPIKSSNTVAQDLLVLRKALPRGRSTWIEKSVSLILDDLERNRYNKERAVQRMRFGIDHAILSEFGWAAESILGSSRDSYARELVNETFGNIEDHRPARTGFLAYVLGK